jgi:hypothetical protein
MALKPNMIAFLLLVSGLCLPARTASAQQPSPAAPPTQTDSTRGPETGTHKDEGATKGVTVDETKKGWSERVMVILRVGREFLRLLFSWQVVLFAIVLFLACSPTAAGRLSALFTPFRSIKVLGAELVFTREAKASADEVLENYTKQIKSEFDRRAEVLRLWDKLQNVVEAHLFEKVLDKEKDFRFTIYVPDVLFQDALYQLVDYYPEGGGRGRRKSLRFGIIGLAWRSAQPQVEGDIATDAKELLKEWGMKRHEATAAGKGRKSFACVVLVDNSQTPVGLFYLDCKEKNAFGNDRALVEAITKGAEQTGLIRDLAELGKELRQWSPVIRPYDE